jgi:hypothetical protein
MSTNLFDNAGCSWTLLDGAVSGTSPAYPLDTVGGVTATATLSYLHQCKRSQMIGYSIITPQAGATISFCLNTGAAMSGLTLPAAAATTVIWSEDGIGLTRFAGGVPNANLAFKTSDAGVVAVFFWRKL